jgi:4-hydroxybenzoate polyprenyltransferase
MTRPGAQQPALVVDLDHTLVRTDTLLEQLVALMFRRPWSLFLLLPALMAGRARFKAKLAALQPLDPATLPYREPLLDYLRQQRAAGRPVHLVTAAHRTTAEAVAAHCGLFDTAEGSDGGLNLKGGRKAERLAERFPEGFAYAGDSRADLRVWARAKGIVLAGAAAGVRRRAQSLGAPLEAEFQRGKAGFHAWRKALRLHQWSKNLLVFVPLLLSKAYVDPEAVARAAGAFLALGCIASATYMINDLADLPSDRRHATKRRRPLAAGDLRIEAAGTAILLLLLAGALMGAAVGPALLLGLAGYALLTLAYTFRLKRLMLIDVMTLAGLYTLRLLIGAAVLATAPSIWLLTFSLFFFFSISLAKRYAEIRNTDGERRMLGGRGYRTDDGPAVLALGVASSIAAVQVVVLYLVEEAFPSNIYANPHWLWAAPLLLTVWAARVWLIAGRGELDEDPVAFAIQDRVSWALAAPLAFAFALATLAWD